MLAVTKTAFRGAHLSVPQIVERRAQGYAAIRATGPMTDLPTFAPPLFPRLHDWLALNGVPSGTQGFFRYTAFGRDGSVELEVGTTTRAPVSASPPVIAGLLPAGRYAMATYAGPYDRLHDAFCMLEGWMGGRGLTPEGIYDSDYSRPACQLEVYRVSPAQTDNPSEWETDLLVKLAD